VENNMPEQFTSWAGAIEASVSGALALFLASIPKVIAFVVIVAIGWALAGLAVRGVEAVLRRVRFNDLAHRSGLGGFVDSTGVNTDATGFTGLVVKWFIRLITLVVAFDALGLPAVSEVLRQLLLWLPNLVVALVVLVIGGLAANAASGLARASAARADFGNAEVLAGVARYSVWAFAIVVAVNQIGIASDLVNTLFTAVVAGLALALGLAFGLGGRDTAAEIVRYLALRMRAVPPELSGPAGTSRDPRERGAAKIERAH
jgi:hypothetical protein